MKDIFKRSFDLLGWDDALRSELMTRMSEEWRHYHTLEHIEELFHHFDFAAASYASLHHDSEFMHVRELFAAIWFHDIVYIPGAKDNEEQSEKLMRELLEARDSKLDIPLISILIMATKAHASDVTRATSLLMNDFDMAIMGAPPERYRRYAAQIRAEFGKFSDEDFRKGRLQFLTTLNIKDMFSTPLFKGEYTNQAFRNVEWEINMLNNNHA